MPTTFVYNGNSVGYSLEERKSKMVLRFFNPKQILVEEDFDGAKKWVYEYMGLNYNHGYFGSIVQKI